MPIDIEFFGMGSTIGYWDFIRDIPLFKNIGKLNGKGWKERLQEEYEKLNYLKSIAKKNIIFDDIQQDKSNNRLFQVQGHFPTGRKITFTIRLPVRYPMLMPIAENFYIKNWYVGLEKFRAACFGKMKEKWRKDGRYGIAHFLVMLAHYTAMAAYSINTPKPNKSKIKKKRSKTKQKRII